MRTCGTQPLLFLLGLACVRVKDVNSSESCPIPVFSPSSLVVKFGDPAFASCSICNGSCESDLLLELEEPLSSKSCSENLCIWNVTHITQWGLQPICYIFDSNCQQTSLKVTVYKPPERVSLSFEERSLLEGTMYSLHCEVEAVAPARLLTVTFYRNHIELGSRRGQSPLKNPVNQSLSLAYTVSREDHGAHFYCEARLELGPGGPQPPLVVRSQNITANVHYAPHSAEPQLVTVVQGQSVDLDCSSEGNPAPHYSWNGPSHSHTLFSDSVFTVHSASSQHEGQYSCNASNSVGSVRRIFTVTVRVNYIPILVGVVLAGLFLALAVAFIVYRQYYKHSRTGHYSFLDMLHLHRHNTLPTAQRDTQIPSGPEGSAADRGL